SSSASDWVWLEVYNAPAQAENLIGQVVRLTWKQNPLIQAYVKLVTTDVRFTAEAYQGLRAGNVHPTRLNGRTSVGPLQSLAGARPNDDVTVRLDKVTMAADEMGLPVLQVGREPTQITGRFYGLVDILGAEPSGEIPPSCPGSPPCPSELYRVRHYNRASGQFDGPEEIIRIPQQPPGRNGRFNSTPRQIEDSPAGKAGWYIYGSKDRSGVFTVQALKPRALFLLKPDRVLLSQQAGRDYIERQNWQDTETRKGTEQIVAIDPTATQPDKAIANWQEGDYGLVIHLFGSIGGKKGELGPLTLATGHFAYGLAQVVRDPFTEDLQFDIHYQQIYAHNTEGIVAGTTTWENYMGNLQRGWLGT
ncbi:MAG: type II CAAX prenyl endopeptidase Rce1 family protein, partial [Microcystaceae cyanobacterium]